MSARSPPPGPALGVFVQTLAREVPSCEQEFVGDLSHRCSNAQRSQSVTDHRLAVRRRLTMATAAGWTDRDRVGGDRRIVHHARFNPWRGRIVR